MRNPLARHHLNCAGCGPYHRTPSSCAGPEDELQQGRVRPLQLSNVDWLGEQPLDGLAGRPVDFDAIAFWVVQV